MKKLSIVIIVVVFASINVFLGISYSQGKIDLKFLGINAMADVEAPTYCTGTPGDPYNSQYYTFTWATGNQILSHEYWYKYRYLLYEPDEDNNDGCHYCPLPWHYIWAKNESEARQTIGMNVERIEQTSDYKNVAKTICDSQNSGCCAVVVPVPSLFPDYGGF